MNFQPLKQAGDNRQGAALVIILAFVVLIAGLVVAFFSRAMSERQVSNSSANQTKADLFSQGVIDQITGDLKQEITAGSVQPFPAPASGVSIYAPVAPAAAAPGLVGSTGIGGLENLLKRSARGQSFYSGTNYDTVNYPPPTRAAALPTDTSTSLNGRSISKARWNKHLLLPKATLTSDTDFTPTAAFTAPDWIIVARDGSNPKVWNSNMQSSSTNAASVLGRYAYAIYDEGGLLDTNVAGYPTDPAGNSDPKVIYKSALAFADLSQLPGISALSGSSQRAVINSIIGWRNYASAQPAGSMGIFDFTGSPLTNYTKAIAANTNGFLNTSNTVLFSGQSDRRFFSRQQLIKLLTQGIATTTSDRANLQNALQYLGTFSRALDQPSVVRNPNRPRIVSPASTPPVLVAPNFTGTDNYQGNNDGAGGDDLINPSFLTVRAVSAFLRNDGSKASVGEPLVKKRFSLKRLAWVTFEGPSSTASAATQQTMLNSGVSQATISAGTDATIYSYFGLKWNGTNRAWTYDHGSATSPNRPSIMTLSQVAGLSGSNAREPDFPELLKAAITVGSLAKGGPNLNDNSGNNNYQYVIDTSVDYHVLQIMANLIDQADADSYPTLIQIAAGGITRTFRGVEDLPYFYRYQPFSVVTRLPSPLLSKNTDAVTFPAGTAGVTGTSAYVFKGMRTGTLTDPGEAALLYIPEVWNPHDANNIITSSSSRPSQFQVVAITDDPASQTPAWQIGARSDFQNYSSSGQGLFPSSGYPQSVGSTLSASNTPIQFSDSGGKLFREPTLLWNQNSPTGIALSGTVVIDINSTQQYAGILVAKTAISGSASISGTNYVIQGSQLEPTQATPANSYPQITFWLQYKDPGGNWITYDEKYPDLHGLQAPIMVVNKSDWASPANQWKNPFSTGAFGGSATGYDPRTPRFGIGTALNLGEGSVSGVSPEVLTTNSTTNNDNLITSNFSLMETDRPRIDRGDHVNYSNPCMTSNPGKSQQMRWFSGIGYSASNGANTSPTFFDGLLSQNNPAVTTLARDNLTTASIYYEDADGVCRRAMGAYANTSLAAGSTVGLPMVTSGSGSGSFTNGIVIPSSQSQSRPMILNRPFNSVAEMSYAFRGAQWKNIDFFTPESGDAALLDVFCINEPPSDSVVAGKVDLNTHQIPVLQSLLAGACRDEMQKLSGAPAYALPALSGSEANMIATQMVNRTIDGTTPWHGPLANVSEIVGRFVGTGVSVGTATDQYTYLEPMTNVAYTYSGLGSVLGNSGITWANASAPIIQRFREAAIRPLADCGQTRVWNLLIDVVSQTGRYPLNASSLDRFVVEGEKRYWVHLAIDRYTGAVIDKQIETVNE